MTCIGATSHSIVVHHTNNVFAAHSGHDQILAPDCTIIGGSELSPRQSHRPRELEETGPAIGLPFDSDTSSQSAALFSDDSDGARLGLSASPQVDRPFERTCLARYGCLSYGRSSDPSASRQAC
jgi:hypothetical protein